MPELLQGLSHHVAVELSPGHPDGDVRMWLKGKVINMTPEEARSLADVLVDHASRAGAPELGTTLTPTPSPVTPPPAPELPDDDSEFDEVA